MLHTVAQAHRPQACAGKRCKGQDRHGIRVVKHPRLGAEPFRIMQDVEPGRAGTQSLENAAWTDGIANALVDPILHGNIEVVAHVRQTCSLNRVDDKITTRQQVTPLSGSTYRPALPTLGNESFSNPAR